MSTPVTASTIPDIIATENNSFSLSEEIKKFDTDKLIEFLRGQENLHLIKEDFEILRNERITGYVFLDLTEEKLRSVGFALGPASALTKFVKECKEQKKVSFSSYENLKEVNYGIINSGSILVEAVKNLSVEELVEYLKNQNLKLDDDDFTILRKEKISGSTFLKLTEDKFRSIGLPLGPASILADAAEELKTKILIPKEITEEGIQTNLTVHHVAKMEKDLADAKDELVKISQKQFTEQGTQSEMKLITSDEYQKQLQKAIDLQGQLDLVTKTKEELLEYLKVYRQLRVLDCLFIGDKSGDVPYAIEEDKVAEFLKQHTADNLAIHFYSGTKIDTSSSGKCINALSANLTNEITFVSQYSVLPVHQNYLALNFSGGLYTGNGWNYSVSSTQKLENGKYKFTIKRVNQP
jgi:hypothetical protein